MSLSRKLLVRPDRRRRIPSRFSWLDQRLVRDGHLQTLSTPWAAALYLFLTTVGDSNGISWYSDRRTCAELGCSQDDLADARKNLAAQDLVGYDDGVYQVLELPTRQLEPMAVVQRPNCQEPPGCVSHVDSPATPEQVHAIVAEFRRRINGV